MFSELNYISIKNIKKVCEPSCVDIEDPDILWLSKNLLINAIKEDKFKGLTYATAALIWLFYEEKK